MMSKTGKQEQDVLVSKFRNVFFLQVNPAGPNWFEMDELAEV